MNFPMLNRRCCVLRSMRLAVCEMIWSVRAVAWHLKESDITRGYASGSEKLGGPRLQQNDHLASRRLGPRSQNFHGKKTAQSREAVSGQDRRVTTTSCTFMDCA